jgi:23S rRNA (guanosine2251-2'-O)-methyltransferase
MDERENAVREDLIEGRNAVAEALRAGRTIDKLFVARGETDRTLGRIIARARERGIPVTECDRRKLDSMSVTHAHQGVIAQAAMREYSSIDEILSYAEERGEDPFVVVCDEIADPHNLGAILRTAECAGVHGVIIPKRRSAGITAVVDKASAGAAEHIRVARVPNISAAIRELKDRGLWVYGAEADAPAELWDTSLTGSVCLVIGSEGFGLSRLVRENCDVMVRIPLLGKVTSLNASASAAVMIYEVVRQRLAAEKREG